jgi:hypothetical protein
MIIDQMREADRIEYLENLLNLERITLESVTKQRDELRADLEFRRGLFQVQEQQLNDVRVENERLKRLATWPHDTDPFTSPDHDNDSNIYS